MLSIGNVLQVASWAAVTIDLVNSLAVGWESDVSVGPRP
jgi:hypothetical protein